MIIILLSIVTELCISCQKQPRQISPEVEQQTYLVRYYTNCDSAFIRYAIAGNYYKHYVSEHFDTTFYVQAGEYLMLTVTAFDYPMNAGCAIGAETIKCAANVPYFKFNYYIH